MQRGSICYATAVGGLDHDQGTRPWLVIGRTDVANTIGETIALPITHQPPLGWAYPLCWALPPALLPTTSWVLIARPRALRWERLRDEVARLDRSHLDEIIAGMRQLIED